MKRSTIKLAGLVAVGLVIGGTAAAVTESHAARSSSTSTISELPLVGSVAETAGVGQLVPALPDLPIAGLPTDELMSQLPVAALPSVSNVAAPAEQLELPVVSGGLPVDTGVAGVDPSNVTGLVGKVTDGLPVSGLTGELPTDQLLGGVTQQLGGLFGGLPVGGLLGS